MVRSNCSFWERLFDSHSGFSLGNDTPYNKVVCNVVIATKARRTRYAYEGFHDICFLLLQCSHQIFNSRVQCAKRESKCSVPESSFTNPPAWCFRQLNEVAWEQPIWLWLELTCLVGLPTLTFLCVLYSFCLFVWCSLHKTICQEVLLPGGAGAVCSFSWHQIAVRSFWFYPYLSAFASELKSCSSHLFLLEKTKWLFCSQNGFATPFRLPWMWVFPSPQTAQGSLCLSLISRCSAERQ